MDALTTATQQVLQIVTNTMTLSGLNLVVTAVGFTVLNGKIKNLEGKLIEIQKGVTVYRPAAFVATELLINMKKIIRESWGNIEKTPP